MEIKAKCESLGIPAAINAEFQTGRMVRIVHYPVTNYRPHRVFAAWRDFDGKTVRRRLQDIESRFSEASENYAIQAAGQYLEWLSDNRANCLGNEFRAVLTGVAYAYDGASENESAVIVYWRDIRDMRPHEYDSTAARVREIESSFKRIANDINGNPRYWIHDIGFPKGMNWNAIGFRKYRGKEFGGGYVCTSYNIRTEAERIAEAESLLIGK